MSEETIQQNENKKECKCKAVAVVAIVALIFSIASLIASTYTLVGANVPQEGKKVVISTQYDKGQSLEKALNTKKPVIVFFYTDWCGYCQRFAPTYFKLSKDKDIKKNFAIAYVNCEKPENSKLTQEYNIQGFPTVFVIDKDSNRTQLENQTFFSDDSVKQIKEKALELIGENK